MYERNDTISFLSCGIALYVGGIVKDVNGLFYSSPAELEKIGVKTRMSCEIAEIDVGSKIFKVKNQKTNEIIEDSYDKLIVITGSWPIVPRIEVID